MKRIFLASMCLLVLLLHSCGDKSEKTSAPAASKHHLNMPAAGIESMMEANSQKIIEGTDGSVIVGVGEVSRKQADIIIRRDDKILDERLLNEKESISFDYEGRSYSVTVRNIKKPLIGAGKAELVIK